MPRVSIQDTAINYRFDGAKGAPVVLLSNSLASNMTMWDHQVPALTAAGFRVLRYDSRGHGGSDVPAGPYTIEMLTGDAVGLLDALELDRVCVMGCSKGGMVAQMLATAHPDRVRALVLTATACHTPAGAQVWEERIAAVRAGGMEAVADATIDRWFTKAGQARMPHEVRRVRDMVTATAPEGFCACCHAIARMDQRESIRAIAAPTLVIVGEQDPSTPPSAAQAIHERIAGSVLRVIPDAAHFVNVEQADTFNAAVTGFLARVS